MNPEATFNELGIDAITGVSLMEWLGLAPDELSIPQRFSKLQSIVEFLKPFPEDTQRFFINKATRGKQVDKLEHMFEYTHLLRRKADYETRMESIKNEKSVIAFDPVKLQEIDFREKEVQKELDHTLEEIYIYEK